MSMNALSALAWSQLAWYAFLVLLFVSVTIMMIRFGLDAFPKRSMEVWTDMAYPPVPPATRDLMPMRPPPPPIPEIPIVEEIPLRRITCLE